VKGVLLPPGGGAVKCLKGSFSRELEPSDSQEQQNHAEGGGIASPKGRRETGKGRGLAEVEDDNASMGGGAPRMDGADLENDAEKSWNLLKKGSDPTVLGSNGD